MKAMIADAPPPGKGWFYEIKWDGVRALAYLEDGLAEFYSRKGERITPQYPELAGLAERLKARTAVVDGEIAALDEQGRPHFQFMQPRIMAAGKASIAEVAATTPVTYVAFDLLFLNGTELRNSSLRERKALLKLILAEDERFRFSAHFEDQGEQLLQESRKRGLEGIVAKRADSVYESKRSSNWLKMKFVQQQEFVICGYTRGERKTFASLMLGVFVDGKLEYCGKVGTGFNEKWLTAIYARLQPLPITTAPSDPSSCP